LRQLFDESGVLFDDAIVQSPSLFFGDLDYSFAP
jgi:hypothetical protein